MLVQGKYPNPAVTEQPLDEHEHEIREADGLVHEEQPS